MKGREHCKRFIAVGSFQAQLTIQIRLKDKIEKRWAVRDKTGLVENRVKGYHHYPNDIQLMSQC